MNLRSKVNRRHSSKHLKVSVSAGDQSSSLVLYPHKQFWIVVYKSGSFMGQRLKGLKIQIARSWRDRTVLQFNITATASLEICGFKVLLDCHIFNSRVMCSSIIEQSLSYNTHRFPSLLKYKLIQIVNVSGSKHRLECICHMLLQNANIKLSKNVKIRKYHAVVNKNRAFCYFLLTHPEAFRGKKMQEQLRWAKLLLRFGNSALF